MYSIGEFSKIVSLPVKTIRYYHEQGLLLPAHVDQQSAYRFFNDANVETARVIKSLREIGFSVRDIGQILQNHTDDADILSFLRARRNEITQQLTELANAKQAIDTVIKQTERNQIMASESNFEITEKEIEPMLIAGIRMKGKYSDCGSGFRTLGKTVGRYICGKAMMLCHDSEYKEDDAGFEPCMPIRQPKGQIDSVDVRELPGGRFATLVHLGPYDTLGDSYAKLLAYLKSKGYPQRAPCREVYLKGPGMIFRGNPKKYLTEIQFLIDGGE
ncbi:MAG: MerR family transcriptional regulator [Planctomycetales bacterium]|nr:MerR family transcriptional regulator [Planctomycetales bacterium]